MTSPRLLTHHDDGEKSAVIWREEDDAVVAPLDYSHNGSFRGMGEGGAVFLERAPAGVRLARKAFELRLWKRSVSMTWILRIALIGVTAISFFHDAEAQVSTDAYATNYFFEEPPSNDDLPKAPPTALEVIHAKVRINSVRYSIGRHNSIRPPPDIRGVFAARLQLIHVSSEKVVADPHRDFFFGVPGSGRRYKYPHTPAMKTKEYFIVAYLDHNGRYWLLGSPVSEQEYEPWQKEVYEYERARSRANARP